MNNGMGISIKIFFTGKVLDTYLVISVRAVICSYLLVNHCMAGRSFEHHARHGDFFLTEKMCLGFARAVVLKME